MIIFINDSVMFVDHNLSRTHRDGGCTRDILEYRGTMFTRKEVEYMIEGLPGLLKTWKNMEERKFTRAAILTAPIECCITYDSPMPELNCISPRYVSFDVLDEFIHMVPTLVRWL